MERPPRPRSQRLLTRDRIVRLLGRALVIAAASVASLVVVKYGWNEAWSHARAVMFTVLAVSQLFYAFAVHVPHQIGRIRPVSELFSNRWLLVGVGAGLTLQFAIVVLNPVHDVFGTSWLSAGEWGLVAAASLAPP